MATVDRIHGSNTQVGVLYNLNANLYIITVMDGTSSAIDLQAEDSVDGLNLFVGGVIEAIVDEISPLAWFTPADTNGEIYVVMDKAINDAAELQIRIRNIGEGTVGPNTVDISGTTVEVATSFTVSA